MSVDRGLVYVYGSSLDASLLRRKIQARTKRPVAIVSDGSAEGPPPHYAPPLPHYYPFAAARHPAGPGGGGGGLDPAAVAAFPTRAFAAGGDGPRGSDCSSDADSQ